MPRGRKYGKRKKRVKRKTYKRKRRTARLPTLGGFPTTKKIRLRYATTVSLNPGAGQVVKHQFGANNMFDPDYTGGGHQPRGFDQWMLNYHHYTVVGSKITIKPCGPDNKGNTSASPGYFGITLAPDAAFPWTSWVDLAESRFAGKGTPIMVNTTESRSVTRTFSAKKYFGVSSIVAQTHYKGTVAAGPTEIANYQMWMASPVGDDPVAVNFTVIIEYIAVLTEPKYVAAS